MALEVRITGLIISSTDQALEWLTYGSIECEPIAVLDSGQAVILAKSLRCLARNDKAAINNIAKCLVAVPERWREAVAFSFVRTYCLRTEYATVGTTEYNRLMSQIYGRGHLEPSTSELVSNQASIEDSGWIFVSRHFTLNAIESDSGNAEEEEEEEESTAEEESPLTEMLDSNPSQDSQPQVIEQPPPNETLTRRLQPTPL